MLKFKGSRIGLILLLVMSIVLAGCSSSSRENSEKSNANNDTSSTSPSASNSDTSDVLEPVTLRITLPGDRPADFDKVIAEAERRMESSLNVKLDVTFIPWSDLKQKTQIMLSAGEKLDLVFDAPWNGMNEMIAGGYYEELDDLLKQYGSTIVANRPTDLLDANRFNGKIMGIPLNNKFKDPAATYVVRKDIREKVGFGPIESYDDLVKFMYIVKEKLPEITPFVNALPTGNMSLVPYSFRDTTDEPLGTQALFQSLVLHHRGNDPKVYNLFEQPDSQIEARIKQARQLYEDGIVHPDIMAIKGTEEFKKGKVAVISNNGFNVPADFTAALASDPAMQLEAVTFFKSEGQQTSSFAAYNFLCIPVGSKNKERAIQFLNWANEKENYDLLSYGIEGEHWEAVGEDQYNVLGDGSAYSFFPYAWIWNPITDRIKSGISEAEMKVEKYTRNSTNFNKDVLAGFKFNADSVANEIAQYNTLDAKYYGPIMNGAVDPDKFWAEFKKEASPYVAKIQKELEDQISAFLNNKG